MPPITPLTIWILVETPIVCVAIKKYKAMERSVYMTDSFGISQLLDFNEEVLFTYVLF